MAIFQWIIEPLDHRNPTSSSLCSSEWLCQIWSTSLVVFPRYLLNRRTDNLKRYISILSWHKILHMLMIMIRFIHFNPSSTFIASLNNYDVTEGRTRSLIALEPEDLQSFPIITMLYEYSIMSLTSYGTRRLTAITQIDTSYFLNLKIRMKKMDVLSEVWTRAATLICCSTSTRSSMNLQRRAETKFQRWSWGTEQPGRSHEVAPPDATLRWSEHVSSNWSTLAHVQEMKCDQRRADDAVP